MFLSHYVLSDGVWCEIIDLRRNYARYMAISSDGSAHTDDAIDELLDTVRFFADTTLLEEGEGE